MAEALGVAGSAVGIVSLSIQIAEGLLKYYEAWKDQDDDVSNMCASLENLLGTLKILSKAIQPPATFDKGVRENVERNIEIVEGATKELSGELEAVKATALPTKSIRSRMRRHARRTLYPFKVQTLQKIQKTVSDARANLDIALQVLQLDGTQDLRREVSLLVRWQKDEETRSILHWLSSANFWLKQADIQSQREPGTGQWLLEHTGFLDWADGKKETLWCLGSPGVGKTVLASTVINFLENDLPLQDTGFAFVYCDHKQKLLQRPEYFIGAIVRQLVEQRKHLPNAILALYKQHKGKGTTPTCAEYHELLQSLCNDCVEVYIVIDALDECIDRSGDLKWREVLANLRKYISNLHLLYTSRHIDDMERTSAGTTCIEILASDSDMSAYIQTQVNAQTSLSKFCEQDPTLQDNILRRVVLRAEGMFLAARLYIETLGSKKSLRAVKKALNEMPEKLDDIYDQTMERIKSHPDKMLALRALTWTIFATRPLRVKELQHAIAINELEPEDTAISDEMLTPEGWIVDACAGLIKIDEASDMIGLVHKTAQEYFDKTGSIHFPGAMRSLGLECLTYLSLEVFNSGPCISWELLRRRLLGNKLLDYAACNFGNHFPEEIDPALQDALKKFLSENKKLESAAQILFRSRYIELFSIRSKPLRFPSQFGGVHYAAFQGWINILKYLISDPKAKIDTRDDLKDEWGRTPLALAAQGGHKDVVELLLEIGRVDIDSMDNEHRTPLSLAASRGHEGVVKLLLDTGKVDVNAKDKMSVTPLFWAAEKGLERSVKQLLATGKVDIDGKNRSGHTPLFWATEKQHEAVVELLLDTGLADPNSMSNFSGTPFHRAVRNGTTDMVRIFLATGKVQIDLRDEYGRTPLMIAAKNGDDAKVKLLLETGEASPILKDDSGLTPLWWAIWGRHKTTVEMLFETREVQDVNANVTKPPSEAAPRKHGDRVKLLYGENAVINVKDENGRTPLAWAADEGLTAVIELLLEYKTTEINPKDNAGLTPFSLAAKRGHKAASRLLLGTGKVDVHSTDTNFGRTPLSWSAGNGHLDIVKLLLETSDLEVNHKDAHGQTPLFWAVKEKQEGAVKLLLESVNVDVNLQDDDGRTPLMSAVENLNIELIEMLLAASRINRDLKDMKGRTALSMAIDSEAEEVVQLLTRGSHSSAGQNDENT